MRGRPETPLSPEVVARVEALIWHSYCGRTDPHPCIPLAAVERLDEDFERTHRRIHARTGITRCDWLRHLLCPAS